MTDRIDFELWKPHTHAGKAYEPKAVIQVTPRQANFLEERRIGQRVNHPARKKRKSIAEVEEAPAVVSGPLD